MTYRSELFKVIDEYIETSYSYSPGALTYEGRHERDHELDSYALDYDKKFLALDKEYLEKIKAIEPIDEIDRLAKDIIVSDIEESIPDTEKRIGYEYWGVIHSAVTELRQLFEAMPTETEKDIENIILRLVQVPRAYEEWKGFLLGIPGRTAKIHVEGVAKQLLESSYKKFTDELNEKVPHRALDLAGRIADASNKELSEWLMEVYYPLARDNYAVGEEAYRKEAEDYTYKGIDLRATYESGLAEVAEINRQMWELAKEVAPEAKSLKEITEILDKDERYLVHGTEALLAKLQKFTQDSIDAVNGIHFDIDPQILKCDVKLAPEGGDAAPYYIGPSDDLKKPGTTWFPTQGLESFPLWVQLSTWYHEAVPGHHLQIGTATAQKENLSRYQRSSAWNSGYGEGWALYAERLMDELGFFTDPGYKIGYLANQALRAARLVVDIGLHLEYEDENGEKWTRESATQFLIERALMTPEYSASEVDRYLSWPGQAISYKIGERTWVKCREDAKARLGDRFSLKDFHDYALKLGPMSLEMLIIELGKWNGEKRD